MKAQDTFDRSQPPEIGPNPVVKVPALWQDTFANGLKVVGTRTTEVPLVTLLLTIQGGHRLAQTAPAKAGLAALTAALLKEGTQQYTGEQFAAALRQLGSELDAGSTADNTTISAQSLSQNLPATLALLQELLLHPRFDPADFERVKKRTLEGIASQATQPVAIADQTYSRLLYGPASIMSVPTSGTAASVASLTLNDVKAFYAATYAPNISSLVVVGDVTEAELLPQLGFLKSWVRKDVVIPPTPAALAQPDKTRFYFVSKPGAPQSEIRVGYLTSLPYDATGDYYKATLANYVLGGAFNSRLNLNLRENKGYTYGARSGFLSTRYPGPFTAQAGVRADVTAPAIKEFMRELAGYQQGITPDELAFLQSSVGQSDALRYETGQQKAAFLARVVEYHLPLDYLTRQSALLHNLTQAEVQAVIRQDLPANLYLVVVGDRQQLPAVQALGYKVVELDAEGHVVAPAPPAAAAPAMPEPPRNSKRQSKE